MVFHHDLLPPQAAWKTGPGLITVLQAAARDLMWGSIIPNLQEEDNTNHFHFQLPKQ